MYKYSPNTIAGHRQNSLFLKRDYDSVPANFFVEKIKFVEQNVSGISPDSDALSFYFGNHVFNMIAKEFGEHRVLPYAYNWMASQYVAFANNIAERLIAYTAIVIAREARHVHHIGATLQVNLFDNYGKEASEFAKSLNSGGEGTAKDSFYACGNNGAPIGKLVGVVEGIFSQGKFSSGYGGKPWRVIAETLLNLCRGDITGEMFIDTAFTLAHNNGPMFNKGIIYNNYSSKFISILDVQRSGQIPSAVFTDPSIKEFVTPAFSVFVEETRKVFPELVCSVDWEAVQNLGSIGNYASKIKAKPKVLSEFEKLIAKTGKAYKFGINETDVAAIVEREGTA